MLRDFDRLIALGEEVNKKFHSAMAEGPDSLSAKEAVAAFREFINFLTPCKDSDFRAIAQVYLDYKKELDKKTPGLAEFASTAIGYT